MPRIYKLERESGEVSEFAYPADIAATLRTLGSDDHHRFSEDVKQLSELKPGETLSPVEGLKVTVEDSDEQATAEAKAIEEEKQAEQKATEAKKEADKATEAKTHVTQQANQPSFQQPPLKK